MRRTTLPALALVSLFVCVACDRQTPTGAPEPDQGPDQSQVRVNGVDPTVQMSSVIGVLSAPFEPAPTSDPKSFVFYGPLLAGYDILTGDFYPNAFNEYTFAVAAGHSGTVLSRDQWNAMTTEDFETYDAVVFGDQGCYWPASGWRWATDDNQAWAGAITGEMVILGADPVYHQEDHWGDPSPHGPDALQLIMNGLEFAASGEGTGLYAALGCAFEGGLWSSDPTPPEPPFPVELLNPIGTFRVLNNDNGDCAEDPQDEVQILEAGHPVMAGLSSEALSNWWCSAHAFFTDFPSETFHVLAEANQPTDLQFYPYILATPGFTPPTRGGHGPVVARASGSGHYRSGDDRLLRTFSFTALKHRDGHVTGQYQMNNRDRDVMVHGSVTCLAIDGNQALVGGIVERVTAGGATSIEVGESRAWIVIDNGEGKKAEADEISGFRPWGDCGSWPTDPPWMMSAVENGNIQVWEK